jgi:hypothetical protein
MVKSQGTRVVRRLRGYEGVVQGRRPSCGPGNRGAVQELPGEGIRGLEIPRMGVGKSLSPWWALLRKARARGK